MRLIQGYWEDIAQVNDAAGLDRHLSIQAIKEQESDEITHYFKFVNNLEKAPFFRRVRNIIRLRRYYNEYIQGSQQDYFSFVITTKQLFELTHVLELSSIENGILTQEDIEESEYIEVESFTGGYTDDTIIYCSKQGLIISISGIVESGDYKVININIGWSIKHLSKKDIRKISREYLLGKSSYLFREYEGFLYKIDIIELIRVVKFLKENMVDEKRFYRIKDNLLRRI